MILIVCKDAVIINGMQNQICYGLTWLGTKKAAVENIPTAA
jgi:hypothetical protein